MEFDLSLSDWLTWFYSRALDPLARPAVDHYPPWTYVALHPLALAGCFWGWLLLGILSVVVVHRYLRVWWRTALFVASPVAFVTLLFGNLDLLLVSVLSLPLWSALLVISCKPVALLGYSVRRWVANGAKWQALLPVALLILSSFAVWGWWPGRFTTTNLNLALSLDFWPWSIPIGLALLCTNRRVLWLVGSALLTPYCALYHLATLAAYVYRRWPAWSLLALDMALWLFTIWQRG